MSCGELVHLIMCGREGNGWDYVVDFERQAVATGSAVRACPNDTGPIYLLSPYLGLSRLIAGVHARR